MAYKRRGKQNKRPCYYVWVTLPGFGRVGPWSTGTTRMSQAQRIEQFLKENRHG